MKSKTFLMFVGPSVFMMVLFIAAPLIELALSSPFERVLDLGVGSGCILVTLLAERAEARGVGVDLSEAACLQASANAVLHEVAGRADIRVSNWFGAVARSFG